MTRRFRGTRRTPGKLVHFFEYIDDKEERAHLVDSFDKNGRNTVFDISGYLRNQITACDSSLFCKAELASVDCSVVLPLCAAAVVCAWVKITCCVVLTTAVGKRGAVGRIGNSRAFSNARRQREGDGPATPLPQTTALRRVTPPGASLCTLTPAASACNRVATSTLSVPRNQRLKYAFDRSGAHFGQCAVTRTHAMWFK
jgi:hypothetical protein